jgi:hypothetical protein
MFQLATSSKDIVFQWEFDEVLEEAKDIYRHHGWLTDNYQKGECLEAVKRLYYGWDV